MPLCTAEYHTVYVITSLAQMDLRIYGWTKWVEKGTLFKLVTPLERRLEIHQRVSVTDAIAQMGMAKT